MEFGLFDHLDRGAGSDSQTYRDRIRILQTAEAAGFARYHLAEHHMTPLGLAPSPSVFLAAAAQHTKKIRLGPLVYLLPMYHPLRLIEEICMLDQMCEGRFDIGVGLGVSPYEVGYFGVGADKREIYRELLEVIVKGLTSERLNHSGSHYQFENVPMVLRAMQKPMPPLWAGVGSEDGMAFAARHGINAVALGPTPRIAGIVKTYKRLWEEHRDDLMRALVAAREPWTGALRQIHVAATDAQAMEEAAPAYQHWFDSLNWLWREHGVNAPANLAPDLKTGIAVGAVFCGSAETVRAAISREHEATGYNYLVLQFAFGTLGLAQVERSLGLFAEKVMPGFA